MYESFIPFFKWLKEQHDIQLCQEFIPGKFTSEVPDVRILYLSYIGVDPQDLADEKDRMVEAEFQRSRK